MEWELAQRKQYPVAFPGSEGTRQRFSSLELAFLGSKETPDFARKFYAW